VTENSSADLVRRYSLPVDGFISAADRTRYESTLFDMRRRTLFGQYSVAEHQVWFLREVDARMPAEELAASLRRLAAIPYGHLIHAQPWIYLVPRENDIALGRWPRGEGRDDESLAWLMDYWARLAAAYNDDAERLLPSEAGDTQTFLPEADRGRLLELLDDSPREIDEVQRTAARLEMLNFVISGEIRGRNYYHGPYPGSEPDSQVVVQEFSELRARHQPWVEGLLGYPLDNVVVVRELGPLELSFDLFGFMVVDGGGSYRSHIRRATLVTVEDGEPRPLADDELERLATDMQESVKQAYGQFATWDDDYRISYGMYHYLTEVSGFAEAAGAPELVGELVERMEAGVDERLADIRAMDDVAPVWARWRAGEGFTPPGA
jgi:hypothetical protein